MPLEPRKGIRRIKFRPNSERPQSLKPGLTFVTKQELFALAFKNMDAANVKKLKRALRVKQAVQCAGCNRLRTPEMEWLEITPNNLGLTSKEATHTTCPRCMKEIYGVEA